MDSSAPTGQCWLFINSLSGILLVHGADGMIDPLDNCAHSAAFGSVYANGLRWRQNDPCGDWSRSGRISRRCVPKTAAPVGYAALPIDCPIVTRTIYIGGVIRCFVQSAVLEKMKWLAVP